MSSRLRAACVASLACVGAHACGGAAPGPARAAVDQGERERAAVRALVELEDHVLEELAAADPRLASRARLTASEALLGHMGTEGVLHEDTNARIRGNALDLFAFRARAAALDHAAAEIAGSSTPLPPDARLERELLARLVEEERSRAEDEARLGDASGELVRGIVSTWTPPATPFEWTDRDEWAKKRLDEIAASLGSVDSKASLTDLDGALYPLEHLLTPLEFPKSVGALTELRLALDRDMRALPEAWPDDRLARLSKARLGVKLDRAEIARLADLSLDRLKVQIEATSPAAARAEAAQRAQAEVFGGAACDAKSSWHVRSMRPPPERAGVREVLCVLAGGSEGAALMALYDEVAIARSSLPTAGHASSLYSLDPSGEDAERARTTCAAEPLMAAGLVYAAELLTRGKSAKCTVTIAEGWLALGEVPLDVAARELRPCGEP